MNKMTYEFSMEKEIYKTTISLIKKRATDYVYTAIEKLEFLKEIDADMISKDDYDIAVLLLEKMLRRISEFEYLFDNSNVDRLRAERRDISNALSAWINAKNDDEVDKAIDALWKAEHKEVNA